jgi:hypothetical protein
MLKRLQNQNPDKEYPANTGQKWSLDEEEQLLRELADNIDMEKISLNHKRTIGGIITRRRDMAYRMYTAQIPMEKITNDTKLDEEQIMEIIKKKGHNVGLESRVVKMEAEIKDLKEVVERLIEVINL